MAPELVADVANVVMGTFGVEAMLRVRCVERIGARAAGGICGLLWLRCVISCLLPYSDAGLALAFAQLNFTVA
jgi:hypothetical protein